MAGKLIDTIGMTPLVKLEHLAPDNGSEVWAKLEGSNPAGSVKDRAARSMIEEAEKRGDIKPGDVLVEATSGNTGIALAMIAAIKAYGAELILVSKEKGMEGARDLAMEMERRGEGYLLDQFNNPDNALAHFRTTGPEIIAQTCGRVTHFVSAMGTTGTIVGTGRYLKTIIPDLRVIGMQPAAGSSIPGIRRWPQAYRPGIFDPKVVDETIDVTQEAAERIMRALAKEEGIFCGVSSGGAVSGAIRIAEENPGSVVVTIICDRGDRYLSTGVFGG